MNEKEKEDRNAALLDKYPVIANKQYWDYKDCIDGFLSDLLPQQSEESASAVAQRLMDLIYAYYKAGASQGKLVEANTRNYLIQMKAKFESLPENVRTRWDLLMNVVKDADATKSRKKFKALVENADEKTGLTEDETYWSVILIKGGIFILLLIVLIVLLIILRAFGFTVGPIIVTLFALYHLLSPYLIFWGIRPDEPAIKVILVSLLWTLIVAGLLFGAYWVLSTLYSKDIIAIPNRFFVFPIL